MGSRAVNPEPVSFTPVLNRTAGTRCCVAALLPAPDPLPVQLVLFQALPLASSSTLHRPKGCQPFRSRGSLWSVSTGSTSAASWAGAKFSSRRIIGGRREDDRVVGRRAREEASALSIPTDRICFTHLRICDKLSRLAGWRAHLEGDRNEDEETRFLCRGCPSRLRRLVEQVR